MFSRDDSVGLKSLPRLWPNAPVIITFFDILAFVPRSLFRPLRAQSFPRVQHALEYYLHSLTYVHFFYDSNRVSVCSAPDFPATSVWRTQIRRYTELYVCMACEHFPSPLFSRAYAEENKSNRFLVITLCFFFIYADIVLQTVKCREGRRGGGCKRIRRKPIVFRAPCNYLGFSGYRLFRGRFLFFYF